MAQIVADHRDLDFLLPGQVDVDRLSRHEQFAEFKRKIPRLKLLEEFAVRSARGVLGLTFGG